MRVHKFTSELMSIAKHLRIVAAHQEWGEGAMKMTEVMVSADHALIRQYLVKVSVGLKQIGKDQKKEILTEIDSHLR